MAAAIPATKRFEVALVEARDRRDDARRLLRDNIDAGIEATKRRAAASAGTTSKRWREAGMRPACEVVGRLYGSKELMFRTDSMSHRQRGCCVEILT